MQPKILTTRGTTTAADGDWSQAKVTESRIKKLIEKKHGLAPTAAVWLNQVHGNEVVAAEEDQHGSLGDGDALVTDQLGVALTVRTADCVPVFITAAGVVALAHAGFGGVRAGVLEATLNKLRSEYRTFQNGMAVNFGPHICGKCFELYGEWLTETARDPTLSPFLQKREGKSYFSLQNALAQQAKRCGAMVMNAAAPCTVHDSGLFSHRRGDTKRLLSYVLLHEQT